MSSKSFHRVIDAARDKGLEVKEFNDRAMIQCPAHPDGRPSLSVRSIEGSVLIFCMALCSTNDVLAELGLEPQDMFDEEKGYVYEYPGGRRVHRSPDKRFTQAGNKADTSLYRADRISGPGPIFVVEGEKDVLAIESAGGQAVSAPMGAAAKPERYDWEPLRGKVVHVVADRDGPGRKRAHAVAEKLDALAGSVRVCEPRVGKDASDHIAAGHALEEFQPLLPEDIKSFSEALEVWRDWRDSAAIKPIPTPWMSLNNRLAGGLHPGRLYVVGARTGSGKSVAGQNMISYAVERGFPSLVVSVEMPVVEVVSRIIAAQAHVDYGSITKRDFSADGVRIDQYIANNRHLPMYLCDNPTVSIEQIAAQCRMLKDWGLSLVFIDYAQLVSATDRKVSREQQVAHIVRQAKVMAMELGIAVILAAQLNRGAEDDENSETPRPPQKRDLRESGELEQSADVILLLYRSRFDARVNVVVAKNRTGPEANITLSERFEQARLDA